MSSENSAQKWLIGCLIAGFVGVLLCGGLVAGLGFMAYRGVRQVAQEIGPELQRQGELMQFASAWMPPSADAGAEQLFPETIPGWKRVSQDENALIPELGIARDGRHGTYELSGTKVDVYVYQLPLPEKPSVFDGAVAAIDSAGYSTRTRAFTDYGTVHWLTFAFSPPVRFGRMWWAKDWLIVSITDSAGVNLESFEREYALAIQGAGSAIDSEPAPADQPMPEAVQPDKNATPADAGQTTAPSEPPRSDRDAADASPANPDASPGDPDKQ